MRWSRRLAAWRARDGGEARDGSRSETMRFEGALHQSREARIGSSSTIFTLPASSPSLALSLRSPAPPLPPSLFSSASSPLPSPFATPPGSPPAGPSHLFIATLLLIAARTPNKKGNANA